MSASISWRRPRVVVVESPRRWHNQVRPSSKWKPHTTLLRMRSWVKKNKTANEFFVHTSISNFFTHNRPVCFICCILSSIYLNRPSRKNSIASSARLVSFIYLKAILLLVKSFTISTTVQLLLQKSLTLLSKVRQIESSPILFEPYYCLSWLCRKNPEYNDLLIINIIIKTL